MAPGRGRLADGQRERRRDEPHARVVIVSEVEGALSIEGKRGHVAEARRAREARHVSGRTFEAGIKRRDGACNNGDAAQHVVVAVGDDEAAGKGVEREGGGRVEGCGNADGLDVARGRAARERGDEPAGRDAADDMVARVGHKNVAGRLVHGNRGR